MVVVKPLATGQPRQPLQVGRRVVIGLVTERMGNGIYRTREREVENEMKDRRRYPNHRPEYQHEDQRGEPKPDQCVIEQVLVNRRLRQVASELLHLCCIPGHSSVQEDVGQLDPDPAQLGRAVRIVNFVGERVVLAMHRSPLAGPDSSKEPDDDPKHPFESGRQCQSSMCDRPVQIHGRRDVRDLREHESDRHNRENLNCHI